MAPSASGREHAMSSDAEHGAADAGPAAALTAAAAATAVAHGDASQQLHAERQQQQQAQAGTAAQRTVRQRRNRAASKAVELRPSKWLLPAWHWLRESSRFAPWDQVRPCMGCCFMHEALHMAA